MATALASLLSNRPVRNDVAMTGEITLTGQVLPIGGLKEKSLAAQRAGIKQVIVPDRNEGDVEEITEQEREGLDFVYADDIGDVLKTALQEDGKRPKSAGKSRSG
jgi:ATP-dependent Lon protease